MADRKTFIAYYRVSTQRQGDSGLGLDAQMADVRRYVTSLGADPDKAILGSFTEIESGRKANRPQLALAMEEARRRKATLIIAKLDRLARNVAFVANLIESGVDFVACDNPHASKLVLHVMAAFAEHERDQIAERTRKALAANKARGRKNGGRMPFGFTTGESGALIEMPWRRDALRDIAKRLNRNDPLRDIAADVGARYGASLSAATISRIAGSGQLDAVL